MASQGPAARPHPAESRAGVIGLGTIGSGIAVSLARRGRVPAVYDVRPDAARNLPGLPAPLASPAEVAGASDVVFLAVVDADQVAQVLTGEDGVLEAARPGLVVAVTATIAVQPVLDLAALCETRGVTMVDCGVTGGSKASEHGLVALVGGPEAVVARLRPILEDFTEEVVHCGPLGTGMATKVARNVVTYGCWRAVHEAVELAAAAGVDPATLLEVIEMSDREHIALLTLQRLRMAGRTVDSASRTVGTYLRNMQKDLGAAQDLAGRVGVPVPLVDVARERADDTFAWVRASNPASE